MARALDYASFEELREVMRRKINNRVNSFATRAQRMQEISASGEVTFFEAHIAACQSNLQSLAHEIDQALLERTVARLHTCRSVLLMGALGSTGVVEYLAYMASFACSKWSIAGRMGSSFASGLTGLAEEDAVIIVTKPPFSTRVIRAAEQAHAQGAFIVVITDTHACPALRHASAGFVVPTESPHFYSSYVATMVLVETMVGMLVNRAGPEARARIAQIEESNRRLQEVWDG